MKKQVGFFDVDERLQRLSDLGDQLEAYAATVDFEMFRSPLEAALAYADGVKGGLPAYDAVMMFKILVIQAQNNLDTSKNPGRIGDRLIHFVRLKTEVLEWLGNRAFLILRSGCESSRRRATILSG